MNKFKQVLTKDWEILCLKGQQMDKDKGNEREISCTSVARKQSFVWTYLEEDGHLRRYAHDSCSSTQGCHVGRKKKKGG